MADFGQYPFVARGGPSKRATPGGGTWYGFYAQDLADHLHLQLPSVVSHQPAVAGT